MGQKNFALFARWLTSYMRLAYIKLLKVVMVTEAFEYISMDICTFIYGFYSSCNHHPPPAGGPASILKSEAENVRH